MLRQAQEVRRGQNRPRCLDSRTHTAPCITFLNYNRLLTQIQNYFRNTKKHQYYSISETLFLKKGSKYCETEWVRYWGKKLFESKNTAKLQSRCDSLPSLERRATLSPTGRGQPPPSVGTPEGQPPLHVSRFADSTWESFRRAVFEGHLPGTALV